MRKEQEGHSGVRPNLRATMIEPSTPTSILLQEQIPGVLRHLSRLTNWFVWRGRSIAYINIYARPSGVGRRIDFEPVIARESGFEGIACVDDVARAAVLALQVYERIGSPAALHLAEEWLGFVEYMQRSEEHT